MSATPEEISNFLTVREALQGELTRCEELIDEFETRRKYIASILDGSITSTEDVLLGETPDMPDKLRTGHALPEKDVEGFLHQLAIDKSEDNGLSVFDNEVVTFLEYHPGSHRTDLNIYFRVGSKKEAKELSNAISRLRKRGLIVNQGDHNRNASWYAKTS